MLTKIKPQTARTSALLGAVVWAIVFSFVPLLRRPNYRQDPAAGRVGDRALGLSRYAAIGKCGSTFIVRSDSQPVGAVAVIISSFLPQGLKAAVFASVWVIATGLIALYGLWRFWLSPSQPVLKSQSILV